MDESGRAVAGPSSAGLRRFAPRWCLLGIWLNAADGLVTVTLMPSVARDLGGTAYYGWAVASLSEHGLYSRRRERGTALRRRAGLRNATLLAAAGLHGGLSWSSAASVGIGGFLIGRGASGRGRGLDRGILLRRHRGDLP